MSSAYQIYQCRIIGATPLLMHNGLLADPLNNIAKEMKAISSKRDKTESDFSELSRLEWYGGLYLNNGLPCLPGELIEAMLIESAKKKKKGPQAKAGLFVQQDALLEFDGSRQLDELWASGDYVFKVGAKVGKNRIMRTRAIFKQWAATLEIYYMPSLLNKSEVEGFVKTAGQIIGIGDWRPKFGRFELA